MSESNDPLLEAIVEARQSAPPATISVALLQSYLRGESDELDQARVRAALADSRELREELLSLAQMEGEEAEQRFAELHAPVPPPLRTPTASRRRRRLWWALAAALPVVVLLLIWSGRPVEITPEMWQIEDALREDQFLPLRLRSEETTAPPRYHSARVAVTAALLELYEWDEGLRALRELPPADLRSLAAADYEGLACFDPDTRALALLDLPGRHTEVRLMLPQDWQAGVLIGWRQEPEQGYVAEPLGSWPP